jgi:hypothetical protein
MDLHSILQTELKHSSKEYIAKQLDYNSTKKALITLEKFLEHKDLHSWINHGYYDFKYTAIKFIEKLGNVLGVSDEDIKLELHQQRAYQIELDKFKGCYIFVETNFRRSGQPIFALACCESARRLALPTNKLIFKTDIEIFEIISKFITQHYSATGGKLSVWGKIQHYQYHHTDKKVYTFGVDGKEKPCEITNETRATVSVGGRQLC